MLDLNDVPPLSDGAKPRVHTRPDWVSGGPRAEPSLDDALVAFRQAAAQRGVSLPPEIIIDGEIHRCDTTGKNGDGDAAYLFHADGLPAGGFQNWQDAIGWQDWHSDPGRPLTPAESDELRRKAEADKEKRLAAREARRADTAARAASIWAVATVEKPSPIRIVSLASRSPITKRVPRLTPPVRKRFSPAGSISCKFRTSPASSSIGTAR